MTEKAKNGSLIQVDIPIFLTFMSLPPFLCRSNTLWSFFSPRNVRIAAQLSDCSL